jgi:hypothetical protein
VSQAGDLVESARHELLTRIGSARSSIELASPFLGLQVTHELRERARALRNGRKLIRDAKQAQRIRSHFGFGG